MGLYNKIMGKSTVGVDEKIIADYMIDGEEFIMGFTFIRDSIILTNFGIYMIDVQGVTGKKVEVKFIPGKSISNVSFETAGTFDLDVDIKIGVHNNFSSVSGGSVPISFKVDSEQSEEAKKIVKLIKENYLCK